MPAKNHSAIEIETGGTKISRVPLSSWRQIKTKSRPSKKGVYVDGALGTAEWDANRPDNKTLKSIFF